MKTEGKTGKKEIKVKSERNKRKRYKSTKGKNINNSTKTGKSIRESTTVKVQKIKGKQGKKR